MQRASLSEGYLDSANTFLYDDDSVILSTPSLVMEGHVFRLVHFQSHMDIYCHFTNNGRAFRTIMYISLLADTYVVEANDHQVVISEYDLDCLPIYKMSSFLCAIRCKT